MRDRSGSGFHGVPFGGMIHGAAGAVASAPNYGGAFDGVDDVVRVSDVAALDFTNALTIEMWVYPTAFDHVGGGMLPNLLNKAEYRLRSDNIGSSLSLVLADATPTIVTEATLSMALNTWTHIAVTWDGSVAQFYKNGWPVGSPHSIVGPISGSTSDLYIGGNTADLINSKFWQGKIDEVAVWGAALTPSQIRTHWAAAAAGPHSNLILYSQQMDNAAWVKANLTVDVDAIIAPDGTLTAEQTVEDTGLSVHDVHQTTAVLVAGQAYCYSVYLKAGTRTQAILYMAGTAYTTDPGVRFNLGAGTATTFQGGASVFGIEAAPNGFYRCWMSSVADVSATGVFYVRHYDGTTITYTGDGASGLYVWGAQLEPGSAPGRYIPTTTAAKTLTSYLDTVLLDTPVGYWPMNESPVQDVGDRRNAISIEIVGVDARQFVQVDSIRIQDTLGQPVTARFIVLSPDFVPLVGQTVRLLYFAQVIFSGTMDHITKTTPDLQTLRYEVECLDWSHTLIRRKIQRTFTNQSVRGIVQDIVSIELSGEGVTVGNIESAEIIPLVETKNARIFDVLRDLAGSTGQTFYLDFDRAIQMRSLTVETAPFDLSESTTLIEGTQLDTDRDTYRNRQTCIVTGTPAAGVAALTATYTETNVDQVVERQGLEGGTGLYEEIEELTHPTSNSATELEQLAIGSALVALIVSGTPRRVLACAMRGYGFRSGQIASVALPGFRVNGDFVIQRVTVREQDGLLLFHDVELASSSVQQRAYESWIKIVRGKKVTVKIPATITTNLATFSTPGATTWTVPGGVTSARFTVFGGSGGSGGYWSIVNRHGSDAVEDWTCDRVANGGAGGDGALVVSTRTVVAGQVYDLVVGAKGLKATTEQGSVDASGVCGVSNNTNGTAGTASTVKLGTVFVAQADGGGGGIKASGTTSTGADGVHGEAGAGFGDLIGVGAGKGGGALWPVSDGLDGLITVRW